MQFLNQKNTVSDGVRLLFGQIMFSFPGLTLAAAIAVNVQLPNNPFFGVLTAYAVVAAAFLGGVLWFGFRQETQMVNETLLQKASEQGALAMKQMVLRHMEEGLQDEHFSVEDAYLDVRDMNPPQLEFTLK